MDRLSLAERATDSTLRVRLTDEGLAPDATCVPPGGTQDHSTPTASEP
jgi:hypothetical protein